MNRTTMTWNISKKESGGSTEINEFLKRGKGMRSREAAMTKERAINFS